MTLTIHQWIYHLNISNFRSMSLAWEWRSQLRRKKFIAFLWVCDGFFVWFALVSELKIFLLVLQMFRSGQKVKGWGDYYLQCHLRLIYRRFPTFRRRVNNRVPSLGRNYNGSASGHSKVSTTFSPHVAKSIHRYQKLFIYQNAV